MPVLAVHDVPAAKSVNVFSSADDDDEEEEKAAAEAKRAAESGRAVVEFSAFSIPCVSIAWLNTEGRFRRRV